MIVVYGTRTSPNVQKVLRGLALKGLAHELHEPAGAEDRRRWSPETGRLPVADVDGKRVCDSTPILLRVDELHPEPPFFSDDGRTAAAQKRLVEWVDASFLWYSSSWRQIQRAEGERPPEPPRPSGVSLRSWLAGRMRSRPEVAPHERRLLHEIGHRVDDLARLLADRPFFYADRVSLADLSVYTMLSAIDGGRISGAETHLDRQAALKAFLKRVEEVTTGV